MAPTVTRSSSPPTRSPATSPLPSRTSRSSSPKGKPQSSTATATTPPGRRWRSRPACPSSPRPTRWPSGRAMTSSGHPQSPVTSPDELMAIGQEDRHHQARVVVLHGVLAVRQAVPFYQSVAKKFGVDLVYNAAVSGSAPNYLAQCLAAKSAGATGLFVASTSDTVATRDRELRPAGVHPSPPRRRRVVPEGLPREAGHKRNGRR